MKPSLKHLLASVIVVLSFSISANAQWNTPTYHKGDELKGTSEYYSNLYIGENGYFVCWDNESDVKIGTNSGIFDYEDNYVFVIVGFYEGESLKEKVTTRFYVPNGDADTAYSSEYRTKGLGDHIKNHLKNVGDVRIIASKYSGSDFDITIPMNKDLKI